MSRRCKTSSPLRAVMTGPAGQSKGVRLRRRTKMCQNNLLPSQFVVYNGFVDRLTHSRFRQDDLSKPVKLCLVFIVMEKTKRSSHNWLAIDNNNRWVRTHLSSLKGRVVDLGCGTAPYRNDILDYANEYIGVDWESSFHDRSNVDVFADLTRGLPFADGYADTVTVFKVLEHLPEPDIFLSECNRILCSQGQLFILVPFLWQVHEAPYDYYRYTRYGLEYLLKKNGFGEIQVEEKTGFWEMWILKFNYHSFKFARGPLKYFWIPIWWLGQVISPILDRYDKHPEMTGSYAVLARKISSA